MGFGFAGPFPTPTFLDRTAHDPPFRKSHARIEPGIDNGAMSRSWFSQ